MKKRRLFQGILLTAVLAAAGLGAGCGKAEERAQVEIRLMHGWGGTLATHAAMQKIYDDFSKENPDIKLTCLPSSDSNITVEAANDQLAVDRMPDIVSTNGLSYYVDNAKKKGDALNLMPYIESDAELKAAIHPSVLEVWEEKGELYTIPDALEIMGYWYNEDYFIEAGIVDELGNARVPGTWEEFFQACEELEGWFQKEKPDTTVMALDNRQVVEGFLLARIAGMGEEGMQMVQKNPGFYQTPPVKEALRQAESLYQYSRNVSNTENARQTFLDGKSAIYFNGVWESKELEESSVREQISYANYPTDSGESLAYISPSSGYVIAKSRDQKKEEACIRFLKYMLSEEVQTKIAVETGQAPENPTIDPDRILKDSRLLGNALLQAHQADIQIKSIWSLWDSKIVEELLNHISDISQGSAGYDRILDILEISK